MAVIYQATCKLDGDTFLGKSATSLDRGRRAVEAAAKRGVVQTPLCSAVRTRGAHNFEWSVVESVANVKELDDRLCHLSTGIVERLPYYRDRGVELATTADFRDFDDAVDALWSFQQH